MKTFAGILASLENADYLTSIELRNSDGSLAVIIENKLGSQGSLQIYHHLWKKYGVINRQAAMEGLELYAEHTADARANPGKHPNIDRLFDVIASGSQLEVRCLPSRLP